MAKPGVSAATSWSSHRGFVLSAVGAAVGLGNIWKFPYLCGKNGGGAFVAIYVVAALAVAVPILIGELMIGRRGRGSPPAAMRAVAAESGRSALWAGVGWAGVIVAYLILSYYSVIAGWVLAYVVRAASGGLSGLGAQEVQALFEGLLASPGRLALWHTLFMALTVWVVARGVRGGLEAVARLLMPALFAMLLLLIGYGALAGDMRAALRFLFAPDFSVVDTGVVVTAVGQAFFSIGVSMGIMMAYGAYVPRGVSLPRSALIIAGVDTAVAILAGLAIFPLVFGYGLDPAEGPGLIFVTLPIAFAQMPAGGLVGAAFFLLLLFAALTSAIAVLEPTVAWAVERFPVTRPVATVALGALAWGIGFASVFSFNLLSELRPLAGIRGFEDKTLFDLVDYLTANLMMPIGGLAIALFVGWRVSENALLAEWGGHGDFAFRAWRLSVRVLAPLAIVAIFFANLRCAR